MNLKYLYTTFIIFLFSVSSFAQVTPAEKAALQTIYNTLDGPNWNSENDADTSDDWDFSQPVTNAWYGLEIEAGNVKEMVLSSFNDKNNLSGEIPPEIGDFPFLTTLGIEYADLSGTAIPEEIGNLTTLQVLELGSNNFNSEIPNELGDLTNLTRLSLDANKTIYGPIPTEIGKLTQLVSLSLDNNNLSGVLPDELTQLTNLTGLYIDRNGFTGAIPNDIGNLVNLKYFSFFKNKITSIPASIGGLKELISLSGADNKITALPPEMGAMTKLDKIYLYNNLLTGAIPKEFGNLTNLTYLFLYNNKLTRNLHPDLGNMISVEQINLSNNKISGELPTELSALTSLKFFTVSSNQITGEIPADFVNLINLKGFNFYDNQLYGDIPDFTSLLEFYSFDFSKNAFQFGDFENEFPWYNTNLSSLGYNIQAKVDTEEIIGLNQGDNTTMVTNCSGTQNNYQWFKGSTPLTDGGSFTGTQTATLTLTNLQVADAGVYHCEVASNIVTGLTIARNTITLNVTSACTISTVEQDALFALYTSTDGANWISETDGDTTNDWDIVNPIESWFGLTIDCANNTVQEINLGNNQLTGIIPSEIGDFLNLQVLDLENNFITGAIPSDLGNLTQLTLLDFHNNQLSGDIPIELNGLINLDAVFLYTNSLTGAIPNNWGNINSLRRLFVNDNQLSGDVPDFSSSPNFIHLSIDDNLYQFGGFEDQFAFYQSLSVFNYTTQGNVDNTEVLFRNEGDNTSMVTNCSGTQNNYQWYKGNNVIADGATFTGTQTATLVLNNIQVADPGVYYCEVTSNIVNGLTITRNEITLNVNTNASYACNYAVEVLGFSTEYNSTSWSADKALGEFDVYPNYGDIINTWASRTQDVQREFLELRFDNPSPISAIHIYETYNAGAVDIVSVKNPITNNWEVVYTATPVHITNSRILKIQFPLTTFDVSEIRIDIDSPAVPGWNEIDAVAINSLYADAGEDQIITCLIPTLLIGSTCSSGETFTWSTTNGNIVSGADQANATVDQAGVYLLTVEKNGTTVTDEIVITESFTAPNIDNINNISGCETVTLPVITGSDLTGSQLYYTEQNGGGTSYSGGDDLDYADFSTYPITLYAYDVNGSTLSSNCLDEVSFTVTINTASAEPTTACYETATFNTTSCLWEITGTQPVAPTTACYETASFNTASCLWEVTGTQPIAPSTACYETAVFNTASCLWEVTGTQPIAPTTACYETASFNTVSCLWEVTGTQPTEPTTACYETASFNTISCLWEVTGTQPAEPTTACYETAVFNTASCLWEVTGTQPTAPTTACYETASFNTVSCLWEVTGTQPTEPTTACYETASFNTISCLWEVT